MKPASGGGDSGETGNGRKISPVPDPPITTLKVDILSENSTKFVPCTPNGREPCPFETEFFKGIATIVIRTAPVDENFESFFRGKRMFEVQVQGKFKREPIGEIYVGAECSIKVDMGMLTKSITKAALRFCGTMVNDLHYSFGDNQSNPNYELPHIVAPIFPTFDKVLVTPPGGVLPEMNIPFNEDLDFRKQRIKYRLTSDAKIDLNTTYSFSVNTSNLNLLNWTLVGIPMVRPMDLRSFVGNSSISLVGYEIPHAVLKEFPNAHPKNKLNYVFNMKLTPIEPDSLPMDFPIGSSDDEVEVDDDAAEAPPAVLKNMNAQVNTVTAVADDDNSSDEGEEDIADVRGDDDVAGDVKHPRKSGRISGWFRKHLGGNKDASKEDAADDVLETSDYCSTDYEMESAGDLRYCPACLDLNDYRKDGKRRVLYFMPPNEQHGHPSSHAGSAGGTEMSDDVFDSTYPRLRAYSEIAKNLSLAIIPRMYKNKRLSNNEKRRRQVVETYKATVRNNNPVLVAKLNHFLNQVTEADRGFLNGNQAVLHRSRSKSAQHSVDDTWEGYVALALSRRHWTEQYIVLSKTELLFYRHSDSRKVILRLPLSSVASVQPMRHEEVPLTGFSFFQVETFSRMYYFLVRSDMQLNEWIQAFLTVLGGQILKSPFNLPVHGGDETHPQSNVFLSNPALEIEDELYIAKSACWKLDKKRIFNYRRIIFNPNGVSEKWRNLPPNELMENILITAYSISHYEPQKNLELSQQWVKFLDLISLLQTINVSVLSEKERIVFFLNLYHVMIIHGNMTIGPPPSWNYWNAFFNHITYLVGYEIISIADVDHNLLRAAMSRPSSLSIIPVPVAHFPGMAITHRDFRLNFCINNGSKSMPSVVPIYKVALLDKQMDEMTALHLMQSCEVDLPKRIINLPKMSLHDFAVRRIANTSSVDYLRCLLPYLKKEDKINVMKLLSDGSAPVIRFKPASLRCRVFQVLNNRSTAAAQKPQATSSATATAASATSGAGSHVATTAASVSVGESSSSVTSSTSD